MIDAILAFVLWSVLVYVAIRPWRRRRRMNLPKGQD